MPFSITEIHQQIQAFKPLCFPGLEPFDYNDIIRYIYTPSQFEFSLKKVKGQHVLYSLTHAHARQAFFNTLPQEDRCKILTQKLNAHQLNDFDLADVQDIGFGHSVYAMTLKAPLLDESTWVLKHELLPNQSLFCKLLESLGWPRYTSLHLDTPRIKCELSQYLGHTSLYDGLKGQLPINRNLLEQQLAQHAALGDILGRGDRHYNNYMLKDDTLYPIDISFLFWEGNEDWNYKYIAGGIYEFSMLSPYTGDILDEKMDIFFHNYFQTLKFLKTNEAVLENQLATFSGDHPLPPQAKIDFIQTRLADIHAYFEAQKKTYLTGFDEMRKRQSLKRRLQEKIQATPEILDQHPLLKMYHLTDRDQPSSFFLLEEHSEIYKLLKSNP